MSAQNKTTFLEIHPAFLVSDLKAAADFYCDVIGFEKKWEWGDPLNRIGVGPLATARGQAFEIHLITEPHIGQSGNSFVYIPVENLDALYEKCLEHEVQIDLEMTKRDWGMKDFRISDPFGNRLGFGEVLDV